MSAVACNSRTKSSTALSSSKATHPTPHIRSALPSCSTDADHPMPVITKSRRMPVTSLFANCYTRTDVCRELTPEVLSPREKFKSRSLSQESKASLYQECIMYLFCIGMNSISPYNSSEYWVWVQVKDERHPSLWKIEVLLSLGYLLRTV